MSVINTNVMSLSTQLNLSRSQSALGTAIERLSSGMRINSAKDDAAGQAIANRFTSNIKGLAQARRNSMDGISIAQTTEGALNEINNNLQRVRELSVQAANGSNSQSDLDSIQSEIDQRLSEIDRISEQTQFNGKKVLADGGTLKLQVGAYDNETIDVNLVKTNVATLGLTDFNVNGPRNVGGGTTNPLLTAAPGPATATTFDPAATNGFTINTANIKGSSFGLTTDGAITATANTLKVGTDGTTYLEIKIDQTTASQADKDAITAANLKDGTYYLAVDAKANGSLATDKWVVNVSSLETSQSLSSLAINNSSKLLGMDKTVNPLADIDAALKQVDTLRGDLGAVQNRLESTVNNLGTAVNNLSASRSRIEDADYAVEVSNMSRAQILQQAGTSVLAQANQVPQNVLSLLR